MSDSRFKKGQSGNPGGRPKIHPDVREMAIAASPEAIRTLVAVMQDTSAPAAARVTAADKVLDRAYGKAVQPIDGDGDGGPIKVEYTDRERARALAQLIAKVRNGEQSASAES
jgi:hypothetical protein